MTYKKFYSVFGLVSLLLVLTPPAFAKQGKECTNRTQCSTDEVCRQHNCLEDGNVKITVSWTSNADVDLHVLTPKGNEISADIADVITADGGKISFDQCQGESCKSDTRTVNFPHVEHVVWVHGEPVVKGKYKVWVENFNGVAAADFTIVFEKPSGEKEFKTGSVGAVKGQASTSFEFIINHDLDCEKDTDGDGLCDKWETDGIDVNKDGTIDLDLKALGADPMQKDIFVEVDWMKSHEPFPLVAVSRAFSNSNVLNPNGGTGIKLHIIRSEEITNISGTAVTDTAKLDLSDINKIKFGSKKFACDANTWFGSKADRDDPNCEFISKAREKVFRYAVFGHSRTGTSSSGRGDLPGNDFISTTGAWAANNQMIENGTFMHEMGHTLNLGHGGIDDENCKPNFLSIMSYLYQFTTNYPGRPLDYSRNALPTLNESLLKEVDGIGGPASWAAVLYRSVTTPVGADQAQDWDLDGNTTAGTVSADINDFKASCGGTGLDVLHGHSDWSNLVYNFRTSSDYEGSGLEPDEEEQEELTEEEVIEMGKADFDKDGFNNNDDVCPGVSDPGQEDADADGVGDACDTCPNIAAVGFTNGCLPDENVDPDNPDIKVTPKKDENKPTTPGDNKDSTDKDKDEPDELVNASKTGCSMADSGSRSFLFVILLGLFVGRRRSKRRRQKPE